MAGKRRASKRLRPVTYCYIFLNLNWPVKCLLANNDHHWTSFLLLFTYSEVGRLHVRPWHRMWRQFWRKAEANPSGLNGNLPGSAFGGDDAMHFVSTWAWHSLAHLSGFASLVAVFRGRMHAVGEPFPQSGDYGVSFDGWCCRLRVLRTMLRNSFSLIQKICD